jgi:hypothetical protein
MELYVSGQLVQTWNQAGSETYNWDTTNFPDGSYIVKLIAYDQANNIDVKEISVTVTNNSPGLTLSLILVFATGLIVATLVGRWAYSSRRRKVVTQVYSNVGSLPQEGAVKHVGGSLFTRLLKPIILLAIILAALSYGFWIAIFVWDKTLGIALATSPGSHVGLVIALSLLLLFEIIALSLLLLFEIIQRRQRVKAA